MTPWVPFLAPTFPSAEDVARAYDEILRSGQFSNGGPKERAFAQAVADRVGGSVGASLVANATAAIQLACSATFVPDRPLAIVPSFTFAAGPLALRWCGYEPVFADIDAADWQPDHQSVETFLTSRAEQIGGILLTQTFGVGTSTIDAWEQLAARHAVPLVIDSAAGFGATYSDGTPLGRRGICEIFSFHATKLLAIGEGGAVTSVDPLLIERIDRLKNFGFDDTRAVTSIGTNAKLPELAAAIGLLQLQGLDARVERRRHVVSLYQQALEPLGLTFQPGIERSAPAFVPARVDDGELRDRLIVALQRAGIECRAYYNPPVHEHPYFAGCALVSDVRVTETFARTVISLPISDDLSEGTVAALAAVVEDVVRAR